MPTFSLIALGNTALAPVEQPGNAMVDFESAAVVREASERPVAAMTDAQRKVMLERLKFCRTVWEMTRRGMATDLAISTVAGRVDEYPILSAKGRKGGGTALRPHNYRAWMRLLGKVRGKPNWANASALADRYGKNIRGRAGAPVFWSLFEGYYLTPQRMSVQEAYRRAVKQMQTRENLIGLQCPSERQVRYWLGTYADHNAIAMKRMGEKWADDRLIGYIRRDWSGVHPNQILFGDHHQLDCMVRVWSEEKAQWQSTRPWLTVWMDARSHYFAGWTLRTEDPSHVPILIALAAAIANATSPPEYLYFDNGKDYLKTGFTEPFTPRGTENQISVLGNLGIKSIHSLPYRARAKVVERMFREVCTRFAKSFHHYCGSRPGDRPETARFFQVNPEHLPSIGELSAGFARYLEEDYHAKPQEGNALGGKSPAEMWRARPEGRAISEAELWLDCMVPYTANCPKVGRGAAVRVDGAEYRSDALWKYRDKCIMVKLDILGGGPPHAFDLDGRHICPLDPVTMVPALAVTDADRKLISEGMREQRRQKKELHKKALEMTGGLHLLDANALDNLDPGQPFEIVKVDHGPGSVKAGGHNFSLHLARQGGFPVQDEESAFNNDAPACEDRELTAGEARQVKLLEFGQAQQQDDAEPAADAESMAAFHEFLTTQTKERNDDDQDGRNGNF